MAKTTAWLVHTIVGRVWSPDHQVPITKYRAGEALDLKRIERWWSGLVVSGTPGILERFAAHGSSYGRRLRR